MAEDLKGSGTGTGDDLEDSLDTVILTAEDLESRIVKQAIEHADLMMLGRLKFLKRETADVLDRKISSLESRLRPTSKNRSS